MRPVAGLEHDLELGPLGRYVEEHPPVRDFEDIGAELAEQRGDPAKHPRAVIDLDAQIDDPVFAFRWPIEPVVISDRDRAFPDFDPRSVGAK